jgi:cell division protein ZapA (FtsZ GTPase activity inhibitor)
MSEIEVAGIKFKGGKIVIILTALGSIAGALWTAFVFYQDYLNLVDKVKNFEAPDLSAIQEQISVTDERINSIESIVKTQLEAITIEVGALKDVAGTALDDARSIKSEIREDLHTVLDEIAVSDKRVREVSQELRTSIRNSENTIRNIIANNESRMSNLVDASSTRFAAARTQIESDFVRKSEAIDTKLLEMESRINKTLERYFKNPLLKE